MNDESLSEGLSQDYVDPSAVMDSYKTDASPDASSRARLNPAAKPFVPEEGKIQMPGAKKPGQEGQRGRNRRNSNANGNSNGNPNDAASGEDRNYRRNQGGRYEDEMPPRRGGNRQNRR